MGLKHLVLEFSTQERSLSVGKANARCHSPEKVQRIIVFSHEVDWDSHHDCHAFQSLESISWLLGPPFLRLGNIVGEHFAFCIGECEFFQPFVEGSDCKSGWHVLSQPRIDTGGADKER